MTRTTVKGVFLSLILASALPLAACSDNNDTPTSPTQPGPPVSENPTTPPTTPPTEPPTTPPTTPPTAPPDNPSTTVTGPVVNLTRGGADGLDISFRIDDFTIVRAAGNTPVMNGSNTTNTSAILTGMTVTVTGSRSGGFVDATGIVIASQ